MACCVPRRACGGAATGGKRTGIKETANANERIPRLPLASHEAGDRAWDRYSPCVWTCATPISRILRPFVPEFEPFSPRGEGCHIQV